MFDINCFPFRSKVYYLIVHLVSGQMRDLINILELPVVKCQFTDRLRHSLVYFAVTILEDRNLTFGSQ